jgi:hypothetical protein
MRALGFLVGVVLAGVGCGGSGARPVDPAAPAAPAAAAAGKAKGDPGPPEYCDRYRDCAEEKIVSARRADLPEGAEVPEAEVAEAVKEEVDRCRGIVKDLSSEQYAWLESCTSCGGSCDVFRCLDDVPEEVTEPFECAQDDPPPPPEEE